MAACLVTVGLRGAVVNVHATAHAKEQSLESAGFRQVCILGYNRSVLLCRRRLTKLLQPSMGKVSLQSSSSSSLHRSSAVPSPVSTIFLYSCSSSPAVELPSSSPELTVRNLNTTRLRNAPMTVSPTRMYMKLNAT